MAAFMTTPLGRDVRAGDWGEYRRDQVLHLLYEFERSPFNDGTLACPLVSICNATRFQSSVVREIANALIAEGLADEPTPQSFRITARGLLFAQAVRSNPLTGSL